MLPTVLWGKFPFFSHSVATPLTPLTIPQLVKVVFLLPKGELSGPGRGEAFGGGKQSGAGRGENIRKGSAKEWSTKLCREEKPPNKDSRMSSYYSRHSSESLPRNFGFSSFRQNQHLKTQNRHLRPQNRRLRPLPS